MLSFFKLSAIVAGVASFAAVAGAQSISSQCTGALTGLLTSSAAQCLNPTGLVPLLSALQSNTSLVPTIDTWLQGMCQQSPCTNASLASVVANITSGCQAELQSIGAGNITSAELTSLVEQFYPMVRDMACLQDTTNNTLCPTEFLNGVQSTVGTLNAAGFEKFVGAVVAASVPPLPASVECSDCQKQWFNIATQNFPAVINSSAQANVQNLCGTNFTNGQAPSDVKVFGTTSSSNSTSDDDKPNGAARANVGAGALALVLLSSTFAVFA